MLFTCITLAAGAQTISQHSVDSLRIVILHAKDDTGKVELMLTVAHAFIGRNTDEAIRYAQQAADLAQMLHDKKDLEKAYNQLGNAYNEQEKYFKALKNYRGELALSKELGDQQMEGAALCNMGLVYAKVSYFRKAMKKYKQAKVLLQKIDYKPFLAQTIEDMGGLDIKKEEYVKGIACFKQAAGLYRTIDNKNGMVNSYNGLAMCYLKRHDYKNAEDFALQGLELARRTGYAGGIDYANKRLDEIHAAKK